MKPNGFLHVYDAQKDAGSCVQPFPARMHDVARLALFLFKSSARQNSTPNISLQLEMRKTKKVATPLCKVLQGSAQTYFTQT